VGRSSPPGLASTNKVPRGGGGKGRGRDGDGAPRVLGSEIRGRDSHTHTHTHACDGGEEASSSLDAAGQPRGGGGWGGAGRGKESKGGGDDYKVFPRRKVGRTSHVPGERAPVVLTEDKLRECFDLPLHVASKKMGICITAIKKVRCVLDFLHWALY
jgi:hypothetical protein